MSASPTNSEPFRGCLKFGFEGRSRRLRDFQYRLLWHLRFKQKMLKTPVYCLDRACDSGQTHRVLTCVAKAFWAIPTSRDDWAKQNFKQPLEQNVARHFMQEFDFASEYVLGKNRPKQHRLNVYPDHVHCVAGVSGHVLHIRTL
ncbi:MAG: hypothetical protein MUD08_18740 [Cytophagales bacterium]|nr:hypothetical protein [Cytophagales bacterium]